MCKNATFKAETLQKIEREVQEHWEKEKIYELDAPKAPRKSEDEKLGKLGNT